MESMENTDFENQKVLDVGCRDGLFSFEAETRGAREVIGIDNDISIGATEFLIPFFKSKVQMHELNLYHLTPDTFGLFDIIIFFGVLYHLRYPFWGLKTLTDCLSDGGILLIESGMLVSEGLENKDLLYCPVEESPYDATSCTFFNRKGLTTTMHSLKLILLNYRTINALQRHRAEKTSIGPFLRGFAKRGIRFAIKYMRSCTRTIGLDISRVSRPCQVTRQSFVFKKDLKLQLSLTERLRKHDDINQYWDSVHDKSKRRSIAKTRV